jgi:two-component system, NarL family, nitrate/nitrite response regulator NarL
MIGVLVVAEVPLYGEGIGRGLARGGGVRVLGTASGSREAVTRARDLQPDVVLVDVTSDTGFETVRAIGQAIPDAKVVALALSESEADVIACAEAGASAYVPRDGTLDDLEAVVESVARGEIVCPPRIAASLLRHVGELAAELRGPPPASSLTARELEIAELLDQGLSNKEIAQRLSIAVPTVKNHVHSILEKLDVEGRAEAGARLR